jgi:hypothetical protein
MRLAAHQQRGHIEFGGTQFVQAREAAVKARRSTSAGLGLKVLSQGHGAGDEQVGILQQHHQVMALRGFSLMLGADGGHGQPALLDCAADAVLMVLGQTVPQGRGLAVAAGLVAA